MNSIKKYCEILGYWNFTDKENGVIKIAIVIAIDSDKVNYFGKVPAKIFLDEDNEIKKYLEKYLQNRENYKVYVEYTPNFETGKLKATGLIFEDLESEHFEEPEYAEEEEE